jgi:putative ATPase
VTTSPTLPLTPPAREDGSRPLADRMRPTSFKNVLGQEHLLADGTLFSQAIRAQKFPSVIFWGPPGCGKTTMARLIAQHCKAIFIQLSAASHATSDLRKVFEQAQKDKLAGRQTLVLVDEIHRFNRTQQDLFLPHIEDGSITLIGATTENPSFELNAALLSRCKVLVLNRLDHRALESLLRAAEDFTSKKLPLDAEAQSMLCALADGDGRYLLNLCEELLRLDTAKVLDPKSLLTLVQKRMPVYDKDRDGHYNLISALHKSLRGSDVNAALYWLARMLDGGDEPLYILRRLVRFASEDVGMADPQALPLVVAAKETYDFIGSPEGELAIAQAVIYLATAPKSNAVYTAFKASMRDAKKSGSLMPPKHILNAPTQLMKTEGYGKGYAYDHDQQDGFSGQNYFPEEMERQEYYHPVERGFEREITKRLAYWQRLREKKKDV